MSKYRKNWLNNTGTYDKITSSIEPHSFGTSWNSIRWNKPLSNRPSCHFLSPIDRYTSKSYCSGKFGYSINERKSRLNLDDNPSSAYSNTNNYSLSTNSSRLKRLSYSTSEPSYLQI
ncbi:unnamed protein product [Dracunculus medinensis]|uniref:Uncharacterized protein n=1 Tax=Dracunculus medinensis TaxID=318479 RepID=A0A0N4U8M9_DRAME|nr:unnamed protein product [Dracunculus medinensis]